MGNIVQEEPALPAEEVSVDGGCSASLEVPLTIAIVRKLDIGVVQVGDHDKPAQMSESGLVQTGGKELTSAILVTREFHRA